MMGRRGYMRGGLCIWLQNKPYPELSSDIKDGSDHLIESYFYMFKISCLAKILLLSTYKRKIEFEFIKFDLYRG